jgi:hypothetical protein
MTAFRMTAGEYVQCYIPQEQKWLYFVAAIYGMKSTGNLRFLFTEDIRAATKCTAAEWVSQCLSRVGLVSMVIEHTEVKNEAEQTVTELSF